MALDLSPTAIPLSRLDQELSLGDRVALLVGAEGAGVSDSALDWSDFVVKIPMVARVDSINVSTASGIAMQWFYARRCAAEAGL